MRHKNLIRMLAFGLSTALLLSGCGEGGENPSESPSPSETATESESVPPEDAPKDYSKFNAYLKMADKMSEMMDILDVYFTNVEYAQDFAMTEGGDYAAIKEAADFYIANTYQVEQALDYVDEEPSYSKADAAVRALGDSPVKLMEAIEDLSGYTQFNEYEEDNLARAPEIHAAIWEPLEVFRTYYGEFMEAMDELDSELDGEDLENLKKDGQMILYYSQMMMNRGEDIINEINAQVGAANQDPDAEFVVPELDQSKLAPLFGAFNTAYEDLIEAMGKEEEQEKVFSGPVAESAMKLYTSKVNALYSSMGALANAMNEGSDYTDAYESVIDAYNGMIDGYNSII